MKSLNENYDASHGSSHETFADLMFCALVVLVLFVMALAIEVSQRVRGELTLPTIEPTEVVKEEDIVKLSAQEMAALSEQLQHQQQELETLREQLRQSVVQVETQKQEVERRKAAMDGEQRFTGAREPASLTMAYDHSEENFYFVSARDCEHADRSTSGESALEYVVRKRRELRVIAIRARTQRGFTLEEAKAIYQGFTTYKEVEPSGNTYNIIDSVVGISYHTMLCGYIAGDDELTSANELIVVSNLLEVYKTKGPSSEEMYPKVTFQVDEDRQQLVLNGVTLSPRDAKEILLSLDGRGAMIDLEGIDGPAPDWLKEEVLIPAGYIAKVPKL